MKKHMKPYFQSLQGGLFEAVNKADVGDNADKMKENGAGDAELGGSLFPR